MLQAIQNRFYGFFKGHERSVKAKKNIVTLLALKGAGVIVSLILLPLTIHYVNATQYGIWLTITSLISWMTFFDIGLGNGLKNKLAAALTSGDISAAKIYVSTTYAVMIVIAAGLLLLFLSFGSLIPWEKVLNINTGTGINFRLLVNLLFGIFCIQFVVQILTVVLTANQQPAKTAYLSLTGQILMVILIFGLIHLNRPSLLYLSLTMASVPVVVLMIGSFIFYRGSYKSIAPHYNYINLKYASSLLSTGGAFFVIQIGALVLFETDNIVIAQIFGPAQVTTFNIAYKLFSIILTLFAIVITPFWSAFTEAYVKHDMPWMQKTIRKLNKFWLQLSILTIFILVLSPLLFRFWFGSTVAIPFGLSAVMSLYTVFYMWLTIQVSFLNGIGKIKLQLYLVLVSAMFNIPLSVWLGHLFGLAGVTLSNALLFIIMGSAFSLQVNKVLNKTACNTPDSQSL